MVGLRSKRAGEVPVKEGGGGPVVRRRTRLSRHRPRWSWRKGGGRMHDASGRGWCALFSARCLHRLPRPAPALLPSKSHNAHTRSLWAPYHSFPMMQLLWYILGFQIPNDYPELMSPGVSAALNAGSVFCLWYKVR